MTGPFDLTRCTLCPRKCGADRTRGRGLCGSGDRIRIARAAPHFWEEPCISGSRGSGAIFFSGCTLGCTFCQNRPISAGNFGREIDPDRLLAICRELRDAGVHNLNFVTADPQIPLILELLPRIRTLGLPIVWNCGGYESDAQLDALSDFVDVWLPDLKFFDPALSERYCGAADYFEVAMRAVCRMAKLSGGPIFSDGLLIRGTMVRHLVIPGCRKDSLNVLSALRERIAPDSILLSLMSQYTPNGVPGTPDRRLTTFEYQSVANFAAGLGYEGYFQEKSSAKEEYTPPFDLTGV